MTANGQAVRPLLIEHGLEQMGNDGHGNGGEHHVVAVATRVRALVSSIEPPACGQRAQQMLVRAPGEDFGGFFSLRAGMRRNRIRDFNVGLGRAYPIKRHRVLLSSGGYKKDARPPRSLARRGLVPRRGNAVIHKPLVQRFVPGASEGFDWWNTSNMAGLNSCSQHWGNPEEAVIDRCAD